MKGIPPVHAGLDVVSGAAILNYWFNLFSANPIATFSTLLAGIWYLICIYVFIEQRLTKKKHDNEDNG